MRSPARAILWQIYWRARWGFAAAAAFLCLASVLVHWLPMHWNIQFNDEQVPAPAWFCGMCGLFANFILMAAFSMSGADARNLTFASHMLVLPVRTRTLVFWPMFSGCTTVALVWLFNASLVFRAGGIAAQLWMPAAALAAVLAAFQALSWTPFAQRWLHGALTIVVLMSPLFVLLLGIVLDIHLSEPVATALLVSLIPIAYVAAISGVGMVRRGDAYDWRAWGRFAEWLAQWRPAATHPFRTMNRAQIWYECRSHVIVPIFIACMMPCFIFVPALDATNVALGWRELGIMLVAPLFVAMLAGGALGNLTDPSSKSETGSFVLVRPIASLSILKAKLVTAAITTAAIWILFLAYISLLLTRPGFPQSIVEVASHFPTWKVVGFPILVLTLLFVLTWKNMVANLWVALTGRKWVENANSFGFIGLVLFSIAIGLWIFFHPEWHAAALASVPWLLGLLLLLKLILAAFVVGGLVVSGLTGPGGAALMVATWLATATILCGLTFYLLPSGYVAAMNPTTVNSATMNIVCGIALFIPFSRLAGAPLALEWNRHR